MLIPATTRRHPDPAPLADAASPLPQGLETRVLILALLLRLSLGILLLPALLRALVATLATRRRRARGLWYLSPTTQDEIDRLSPRAQRAVRRLLAVIGWAMAGLRNRGMRPRPRPQGQAASTPRPSCAPRAPPTPA
jgi:hypothetical protein